MTSQNKIRFGIIGCGVVSSLHAEAILACPNTELVAVSDVDESRARQFADRFGVGTYYVDYLELLASDRIDVVSVCTPSGLHGEVVIAAAQAEKHILCEKPLEIQADKMDQMIMASRTAGVKLGCVYQRRGLEVAQKVKRAIDEGELGRLLLCDAYLKYYRDQHYYDSAGWRGTWKMDGGGALMNQGVHGVDMIQWLTGGVQKVYARVAALSRDIEVEDTAVAVVQYTNGAYGVIEGATTVYPERSTRFELHGEKGTIIFDDTGIQEWNVIGKGDRLHDVLIEAESIPNVHSVGHFRFVEDMAFAILEGREPLVPGEEARKAVDIIHAIYQSARTNQEVLL